MKNKLAMSVFLGCGVLAMNITALAQSSSSNSVGTVSHYDARFVLTATPEAPAGAKGSAAVKSARKGDTVKATLSLQTQGLDAGDYIVTALRASDGSSVTLGQITLQDPSNGRNPKRKLRSNSKVELTDVEANDIAQLIVSDTNSTALLVGDLTAENSKSRATFNAVVPLTPGDAAPDAHGFAHLNSSIKKGKIKNVFSLNASGVATNSTFTVNVDGHPVATATSNRRGKVIVRKLPPTVTTTITTVQLIDDAQGSVAVQADF